MSFAKQELTRRQALALMGLSGAAVALTATGCASQNNSAGDSVANEEASQEAPAAVVPTNYEEYDVIVVGAGGAGLTAAAALSDFGAESVLLLEAAVAAGGNSLLSHGSIVLPTPPDYAKADLTPERQNYLDDFLGVGPQNESEERWWDQLLAEYEDYKKNGDTTKCFDSPLFTAVNFARIDEVTVEHYLDTYARMPEYTEWLDSVMGVRFKPCYGGSGYPWPRHTGIEGSLRGEGWIDGLLEGIEKNNYPVDIRYSTRATSLIADYDGKVVGVNAESKDGTKLAAFARRGVIMATGGFTSNRAMLQQYNLEFNHHWIGHCNTDGSAYQNGDHFTMAQALGAGIGQMERIQCLTQCDSKTGAENTLIGDRLRSLLRVTYEGKRFIREDASRLEMTRAINNTPEGAVLQISDKNTSLVEDGVNAFGVPISTLVDLGTLFVSDSIEGLAESFGADPKVFAETVANYNKYCDDYFDPEFGNSICSPNCKTLEPPFYAYSIAPAAHITFGGLLNDANFRVIKFDGETMLEGLFAIGDTRAGQGGLDASLPDGYFVSKYIMNEVEPQDRTEIMSQIKADEEEAARIEAEAAALAAEASSVSYKDGTYQGTGNGMGGEITVTIEIKDNQLTVTDISPNNETVGIGGYEAIEDGTFIRLIEDARGANFDVISGATLTSNAIQTAVTEALKGATA